MGNSTIFDDVLRTIQERLPKLLIPLINEVFQTSYAMDVEVTRLPEGYQKLLSKVVADSCNKLEGLVYHFECQSTKDGNMILRMVEYDFMIALADSRRKRNGEKIKFPHPCIIYLRSAKNTLSEEILEIEMADGQCVTYRVPVLKLKDYSIEDIFKKNLLILLPYYIINYEKELPSIAKNKEKAEQLLEEYGRIVLRLEEATRGDETGLFRDILKMMQRIMRYLLREEQDLKERMDDIMGGKVLPLPSDKLREARAAGIEQGIEQGIMALIRVCNKLKIAKGIVLEQLVSEFSLTKEQANEAILKYWK